MAPTQHRRQSRGFRTDEAGTIALISAILLPLTVICAALATDLGRLYLERRALQGATDLAAMAAAAELDRAETLATRTLASNGFGTGSKVTVIKGNYRVDSSIAVANRFQANVLPYNAVRVDVTRPTALYFGRFFAGTSFDVHTSAVSATKAQATFSVGSRLAAVRGGIANQIFSSLLGGSISLTVSDYDALANADVELKPFLEALASQLNITAGSYNDVLSTQTTLGNVLTATANASGSSDPAFTAAIQTLLNTPGATNLSTQLSQWIDLGAFGNATLGDARPGFDASVSALELVRTSSVFANGSNQVSIALDASIPGVASTTLSIEIGEPVQYSGWVAAGTAGSEVQTAQSRIYLVAEVDGTIGGQAVRVRLPVRMTLANAKARLTQVTCNPASPGTNVAKLAASTGISAAWIGDETNNVTQSDGTYVSLLETSLFRVSGRSYISGGSSSESALTFTQSEVDSDTIKQVGTTNFSQSIFSSLIDNIDLKVTTLGWGITLSGTEAVAVKTLLGSVSEPLDNLAYTILSVMGVYLGEADIRVYGIRCGSAVLAQ